MQNTSNKLLTIVFFAIVHSFFSKIVVNNALAESLEESTDRIQISFNFKAELVASERLIESPVAFDWGADGKLWIVEMCDYPQGRRGGVVCFLKNTRGDGIYDKSTLFLENLDFPNGIYPWRKGMIVSAGDQIFYAESSDGKGKASVHKTILSGIFLGNPQHRVNGFDYGLDNWLYVANGDSGGRIHSFADSKPILLGECDFRFKPETGGIELEVGPTQYGRHRDDWGNWFGNYSAAWLWHYYVPLHYFRRNP